MTQSGLDTETQYDEAEANGFTYQMPTDDEVEV